MSETLIDPMTHKKKAKNGQDQSKKQLKHLRTRIKVAIMIKSNVSSLSSSSEWIVKAA
jgi:hypothetical protein